MFDDPSIIRFNQCQDRDKLICSANLAKAEEKTVTRIQQAGPAIAVVAVIAGAIG